MPDRPSFTSFFRKIPGTTSVKSHVSRSRSIPPVPLMPLPMKPVPLIIVGLLVAWIVVPHLLWELRLEQAFRSEAGQVRAEESESESRSERKEEQGREEETVPAVAFADEDVEFFEKQVRPILVEHCFDCHGGKDEDSTRGGLRLDSRQAILAGGDTGPGAEPGNPGDSLIIDAVEYGDLYQMPPKSKMREADIQILTRWVELGLPWPAESGEGTSYQSARFDVDALKSAHWAWQPLTRPTLPEVRDDSWIRDPLDRFILDKLQSAGRSPAPPASPHALIRRLYFDLIGLPPPADEVRQFLADPSPAAYEEMVDRLLDSPQFGERWARHWLDLVRYAESRGHEFDYDAANAYQYRDYVIRALNADVPYDQWMVEHIAGDLLEDPRRHPVEGFNESILGTGFWFLGEWVHSPVDIRMDECDRFDNMLDVFSKTFLGLTVACARCHDHKFDAIPQSDYYALFGFLQSSGYRQAPFDTLDNHREVAEQLEDLAEEFAQRAGPMLVEGRNDVVSQLPQYLLAAREGLRGLRESSPRGNEGGDKGDDEEDEEREADTSQSDSEGDSEQGAPSASLADLDRPFDEWSAETKRLFEAAAESRGLRPELVKRWAVHLWKGRQETSDPFSLWGRFALQAEEEGVDVPSAVAQWVEQVRTTRSLLGPFAGATADDGRQENRRQENGRQEDELTGREGDSELQVILDFRAGPPRDKRHEAPSNHSKWLTDGYAFGTGPVSPGRLELPYQLEEKPAFRLLGAARRDPFWKSLGLAEQVAAESGRLGSWMRSGQTMRTPSFAIQSGPVHYLVRGSGVAYAAVNSHAMFAGPLHGNLVKEFQRPEEGTLHWVTHDLSRYRGHRAHIEFHSVEDQPFEVLMVVQAERVPNRPRPSPAMALVAQFMSDQVRSPVVLGELEQDRAGTEFKNEFKNKSKLNVGWETLASVYGSLFAELQEEIRSGRLGGESTDSPFDRAALANWYLDHAELFGSEGPNNGWKDLNAEYQARRAALGEKVQWKVRTAPAMWEGTGMDERLMIRGNPRTLGPPVPRRFLMAIAGEDPPQIATGSGRDHLAQWMTDPANPFPSRVMVNRIWHHLTGRGIVASTDNLGVLGDEPTHSELLDHLATSFIDDGWSVKRMIRRVVLSSTYQMSSRPRPEFDEQDPEVLLLHRMRIRRLQGEAIRDTLLTLAGRLDATMYGPSVPIHLTPFMQGRGRPGKSGPLDGEGRRSIYIAVRRNFLSPMMLAFDTPQPFSSVGRRNTSNVPAQALIMMNDPLVVELARQWAERVISEQPKSVEEGITRMYWQAFSRPPSESELLAARSFLGGDSTQAEDRDDACDPAERNLAGNLNLSEMQTEWAELAHVLMNVKELILVE
jgi:hypothetical protein